MMIEPDYPQTICAFNYRGFRIEIIRDVFEGQEIFSAWANYEFGSAIAVPVAMSRIEAVRDAKRWVDCRLS